MPYSTCSVCGKPYAPTHHRQAQCPEHHVTGRQGRSPTTQAQDAEYRRNRALVLKGGPPCSLQLHGCTGAATTADHKVAVARGGTNRIENLQPACSSCNGRKGAGTTAPPEATQAPVPTRPRPITPRLV